MDPVWVFSLLIAIFSLIEFFVIRTENSGSLSRLLLPILFSVNIAGVFLSRGVLFYLPRQITVTLLTFLFSWISTDLLSGFFWGDNLAGGDLSAKITVFIVSLLLVMGVGYWSIRREKYFQAVQFFFGLFLLFVILNLEIFDFQFMAYGDYGRVSKTVSEGGVSARWIIGTSLLTFLYSGIVLPISQSVFSLVPDTINFVDIVGAATMALSSIYLLKKYPNRLSVVLPMTLPVWILFASGYNEYYPFIAAAFVYFLVVLFDEENKKYHPVFMGFLAAVFALLYAGFIPFALGLIGLYFVRAGAKKGTQAVGSFLVLGSLLLVVFWPGTLESFFSSFKRSLNLGDTNSYRFYVGKAIENTPFFNLQYGLSYENMRRVFFMIFWGGGFAPVGLLAFSAYQYFKQVTIKKINQVVIAGLLIGFQLFYIVFLIPKLGPFADIDLFFAVYIAIAFVAGYLLDVVIDAMAKDEQRLYQLVAYAVVVGNTAFVLVHLLLWGLPSEI